MRLRRTAIAAVLAAGIVVPILSTATVAVAKPGSAAQAAAVLKPAKASKLVKAVRFQASGTVNAVNVTTGAVTLQTRTTVKSGKKIIKKTLITNVTVATTARIVVNGVQGTLANVAVGHRIVVTGTRSGTVNTATKVVTTGNKITPAPIAVTPSPTQSETPIPAPSTGPTVEPSPNTEPTSEAPTADPIPESTTGL